MEKLVANVDNIVFDIERILDAQPQRPLPFAGMDKSDAAPCTRFLRNECQLGDRCPYRHMRLDKPVVCKHWLRGLCKKGDACDFLHQYNRDKMPLCHFYSSFGSCDNKDCRFRHVDKRTEECPWYNRGFCRHGPHCKKRHVRRVLCPDYELGFCPKGPDCKLAHPGFELPINNATVQSSIRCHSCGELGHKANVCPSATRAATSTGATGSTAVDGVRSGFGLVSLQEQSSQGQGQPRQYRPLDQVTCFKCMEKGHYANNCPRSLRSRPY